MTSGSLGGWNEDDWVPMRLVITNRGGNTQLAEAAMNLEYSNGARIGIDAFAACFSATAADCGIGRMPTVASSASGSGALWSLLVDSSVQVPSLSFSSEPSGVGTIQWHLGSLSVPASGSISIMWAVHLAKGNSTNLACAQGSPLGQCSPQDVPLGEGEASWPGRSLQVRAAPPIPGERTVSIDVAQQQPGPSGSPCLVATAAYGSELAAPVQFLRQFRDNEVQQTYLGSAFLSAFNAWYYTWSPSVAKAENENGLLQFFMRGLITPTIGALALSHAAFHSLQGFNSEAAVLATGLSASGLIGIIYLTPIYVLAGRVRHIFGSRKSFLYLASAGVGLAIFGTLSHGHGAPAEIFAAALVLDTMLLSPALVGKLLTKSNERKAHAGPIVR